MERLIFASAILPVFAGGMARIQERKFRCEVSHGVSLGSDYR